MPDETTKPGEVMDPAADSGRLTRRELLQRVGAVAAGVPLARSTTRRTGPTTKSGTAKRSTPSTTKATKVPRRILVVTDGGPGGRLHATFTPGVSPGDDGKSGDFFVFSEVVRALTNAGYLVTRAHRDFDPARSVTLSDADRQMFAINLEKFRFDTADLTPFDQLWLFGVGGPPETAPIDDNELGAIARFMNAGGGVFAVGDHGDIGRPMCGRILRVRSMRTWWTKDAPDNEPVSPGPLLGSRVDTTQPGVDETLTSADYRFNNQSDDRPAPITLTAAGQTHRLLDLGGGRRLAVLPDHMHEGIVLDPFDSSMRMSPTVSYGGAAPASHVEYPSNNKGVQPRPQVLALGRVLPGHSTISTETAHIGTSLPTDAGDRTYGSVGAYDGHEAGVGRVVVTSTFHHFTDVNLVGDPWALQRDGSPDAQRRLGFTASAAGQQHLADQRAFWVSIARWLSKGQPATN